MIKNFILLVLMAIFLPKAMGQFVDSQSQYLASENLLNNPGFEQGLTGWTRTGTAVYSLTTSAIAGSRSFRAVATAQTIGLRQVTTKNAAALAGTQLFMRFSASNTAAGVVACTVKNNVVSGAEECITLETDGLKKDYEIPFVANGTNNGIDISAASTTGTLTVDSVAVSSTSRGLSEVSPIGPWTSYGPTIIGAVTTAPTKGTVVEDFTQCRSVGENYECNFRLYQSSAGLAGSGDYLFTLPQGIEFDSSIPAYTTASPIGNTDSGPSSIDVNLNYNRNNIALESLGASAWRYGSNTFRVAVTSSSGGTAGVISSGSLGFNIALSLNMNIKFRGKGLKGKVSLYSQLCNDPRKCENIYTAKISGTDVVSDENLDWINGNCTGGTGIITCTFNSGIFTAAPNCNVSGMQDNGRVYYQSLSSTGFTVETRGAGGGLTNYDISVICQKQGADFTAQKTITGTFEDVVKSPGTAKVSLCSAKVSSTGVLSDQRGGCFASCTNATTPVCTFTSNYWASGTIPNCWVSSAGSSEWNSGRVIVTTTTMQGAINGSVTNPQSGDRQYFCHGVAQ